MKGSFFHLFKFAEFSHLNSHMQRTSGKIFLKIKIVELEETS